MKNYILVTIIYSALSVTWNTESVAKERQPIRRIDHDRLAISEIIVDRKNRKIYIPVEVNQTEGILEYLAVASQGKRHESLLLLKAEPSELHLALLLAGFEPSSNKQSVRSTKGIDPSLVQAQLQWTDSFTGRVQLLPLSAWIYDRGEKVIPPPFPLRFIGSQQSAKGYTADLERSVIGLVPDSSVVLTTTLLTGNPYRGDHLGYEVAEHMVLPKGTSLSLILQPALKINESAIKLYQAKIQHRQSTLEYNKLIDRLNQPYPSPPPFEIRGSLTPSSALFYRELN